MKVTFYRRRVLYAWVLASFIAAGPAWAQESTHGEEASLTQHITLSGFVGEAFQKNPALRAKKKEYEAARHKVIASWLPEDPMIGVDVEGQPDLFHFDERTDNEYMVEQSIPFPTKLVLKGVVASKDADMAYQKFKEEERGVVWHIEQPYYELFLTKKTLFVLEENRSLLEQILASVKARYESNQVPLEDYLKAQVELSKNSIEIFNALEKGHLAEAHFAHLVGQSLDTKYVIEEEEQKPVLNYTRAELEEIALKKRPELRAMEIGVEKAGASRVLARSEWLPDIKGRIEARQFPGESGIRENDSFIGISVPVWSLLKGAGGAWVAADEELEAAKALAQDMKNEVLLQLHEAYSKVKAANNAVDTYENSILPQAKQQVEVALASYEAGKSSFLALIDAEKQQKAAQLDYYRAVADYRMGLADLRLAVGGDLNERKGGQVEAQ